MLTIFPGLTVQLPEGNPFNATLPVARAQDGCVMVPIAGATGVTGCELTVANVDAETQVLSEVLRT